MEEHTELEDEVLHRYHGSFYLFWVLEMLLQPRAEGRGSGVTVLHCTQEHEAFQGHLSHSVLLLSDEFPLFALYMWRIGALLAPSGGLGTTTAF